MLIPQENWHNIGIIFKKETYRNEKVATAEGQKQRVDDRERLRNVPMTIGKKIAAITGLLNAVTVLIIIELAVWVWQQLIARCQTGTAILFTVADLDEIMQYSDRFIVFSNGQISPRIPEKLTLERLGKMISAEFTTI